MTALLISLCCVICLAVVIVSVYVLLLYCFTGRSGPDHDYFVDQSVLCRLSGCSDCLCACTSSAFKLITIWFLSAFHWLRRCELLVLVEEAWMSTFPVVAVVWSVLIHVRLTVTTLTLTWRFHVDIAISVCFSSSTNSTGNSIVVYDCIGKIYSSKRINLFFAAKHFLLPIFR